MLGNNENKSVKDTVTGLVFKSKEKDTCKKLVMESIRTCIHAHTRGSGSRTTAGETLVKITCLSCVYSIVKRKVEMSDSNLQKSIGATTHQIAIAHETAKELIDNNSMVKRFQLEHVDKLLGGETRAEGGQGLDFLINSIDQNSSKMMHIPNLVLVFPGKDPLRRKFVARGGCHCKDCCVILGGGARAEGGQG